MTNRTYFLSEYWQNLYLCPSGSKVNLKNRDQNLTGMDRLKAFTEKQDTDTKSVARLA